MKNLFFGNFVTDDGRVFLVRCPECRLENYTPAVASGQCAWCGFHPPDHWNGTHTVPGSRNWAEQAKKEHENSFPGHDVQIDWKGMVTCGDCGFVYHALIVSELMP